MGEGREWACEGVCVMRDVRMERALRAWMAVV